MEKSNIKKIEQYARAIRVSVLQSLNAAGSGHLGASLGLADVFATLYFSQMNHRPDNPDWEDRDRLVLSIGHVAPVLYAALAEAGYFAKEELLTLRKLGSRLQGHPGRNHGLPGLELSAGSLGQGLSVAVGMALAAKIDKKDNTIYCIMGDGELQEGSVWEAAMSASFHKLNNIVGIVDRNRVQIDGDTESVMELEPLAQKWESFGWDVFSCDGNSIFELLEVLEKATNNPKKPTLILANTKMGAGVKSIENDYRWHGKVPNNEELKIFLECLEGGSK